MMHPTYFETHFAVADPSVEWPAEFAIITAYAPTGKKWTDEQNAAADERLEKQLRHHGGLIRRITGYSPETGHAEPGWAVELKWQNACDLGSEYLQDAIYFVSGDDLSVSFCDSRRELVRVGTFRDRLTSSIMRSPK
ncbi:MAG: DUF3293 domain-containing protein [Verrucomicrobiaceae bacterium]|nr:DUF3293 domain-containing protein [Verrucomicrobiaceae bacterium]